MKGLGYTLCAISAVAISEKGRQGLGDEEHVVAELERVS
jgi:hypothetical protein